MSIAFAFHRVLSRTSMSFRHSQYILPCGRHLRNGFSIRPHGCRLQSTTDVPQLKPQNAAPRLADDPYPIPFSHPNLASDCQTEGLPDDGLVAPLNRAGENVEQKRARLLYQSRKRGILETDLLLSTFAQRHLQTWSLQELQEFDEVRHCDLIL